MSGVPTFSFVALFLCVLVRLAALGFVALGLAAITASKFRLDLGTGLEEGET